MKTVGLILLLLVVVEASAQTNLPPWKVCRNPVRYFREKGQPQTTVDISPLFQWWEQQPLVVTNNAGTDTNSNPESDRPLTAWYRVTGTKAGTIGTSWVVDAVVYTSPTIRTNVRIILNHPPTLEEQSYDALQAQLTEVQQGIANATSVYESNTNAESLARERAEVYLHSNTKVATDGYRAYSALAVQKQNAAAAAQSQLDQLETTRSELEGQLEKIPHVNGSYEVDWFAVMLGRSKQGVSIYDLGLVSPTPP